jgi:midasin
LNFNHQTLLKFTYILSNTFYTVIKNGFCIQNDEDDQKDERFEDDVDGMGIGEGDGKKDISDKIVEEDEVEGLKNDESTPPDGEIKDEKEGIELEQDFEGVLGDAESGSEGESEASGENVEQDIEEQMGDLDDSASVVDEKLWDGDEPDSKGSDDKTERDGFKL